MIVKEKLATPPTDKFGKAGYEAEKQMAFYLRRAFADQRDVFVFNDIKLQRNGETAQIDHLVLHPFGFYLVESKSVTGSITVNAQGEYTRQYGKKVSGMKSPVTQVKMQGYLLQQLLTENVASLLGKALLGMIQKSFHGDRFRYLVAISDNGVIQRHGSTPPELVKADAVTAEIEKYIGFQRQFTGPNTPASFLKASNEDIDQRLPPWKDQELSAIQQYLLTNDQSPKTQTAAPIAEMPATGEMVTEAPIPVNETADKQCKTCGGTSLEIRYGKYGYYFKCLTCDGNMPVDFICPSCSKKSKLRKAKKQFFWNCSCGFDSKYFENP